MEWNNHYRSINTINIDINTMFDAMLLCGCCCRCRRFGFVGD